MTTPDLATVTAAALAAVQYLHQHGITTLAPAWASNTPNPADLPPHQCKTCGNPIDGDTWPGYVAHMAANHHSLLEQYASTMGVDVPHEPTAAGNDVAVNHQALADTLGGLTWPHDPAIRVQSNT